MASTRERQEKVRVLLLSDESPLSMGVEALLRERTTLEVVSDSDVSKAVERVRAFRPQVVVLGAACEMEGSAQKWLEALSDIPDLRLITLSLHDNSARMYSQEPVQTVPNAAGLLDAFRVPQE